jgi:hypothetical protein
VNASCRTTNCWTTALARADRITRHSQPAVARVITAVTRGLDVSISEGLGIES